MQIFVGKEAIDFKAKAIMYDNTIEEDFQLRKYAKNSKLVLFFYPLDFTFVCPSEIIAFNNRLGDFTERNTKIVAVSVDSHFSHLAWKNTSYNKGGIGNIQLPMVSDISKEISKSYNVLNDESISMRGTFVIDENFILRHMLVNDLPIGRNVDETLRIIDAIMYHDQHGEVCPAGWKNGEEAIDPSHKGISHFLATNADKL
jgi:peroxiredoxin (alkyl hydroperoxide reductase subunit C)